jgi:threonine synthase
MKEQEYLRNMSEKVAKYHFECNDCGRLYPAGEVTYLCPVCDEGNQANLPPKGVLKTLYNYEEIRKIGLDINGFAANGYLEMLPVKNLDSWPKLRIGNTPLYKFDFPNGGFDFFIKDDSQNPSFSFKDRASALVSAYAKENQIKTIVTASTGNAGSSIASICANQGQKAIVLVPASAPRAKLTQIVMYGATIIPVNGSYDEAFELSKKLSEHFGWYNRNTAFNPLTIEGKKTVAFELVQQLETVPDNIFVPVGDGVIISGVYKGFEDLLRIGLIDRMPKIIAIQSENSDNVVSNLNRTDFQINTKGSVADSITVNIPRNFLMTKKYIETYKGESAAVSDEMILEASMELASGYGIFAEPAASASMAGLIHYFNAGRLEKGSKNVILLTGSGLKDLKAAEQKICIPEAVDPAIDSIKHFIHG